MSDLAPITLPSPFDWQRRILDAPNGRKVIPAGRRSGKSRVELVAAVAGHGGGKYGAKQFPGVLEGWDIVWFAQDYPNLKTVIWNEEVKPRFKHLPYADVNENDMRLSFPKIGSNLYFRSAEAIHGVRGIGKRLKGVIIDEAALLDLREALLSVILPALLDNDGWLIIGSTTNSGLDGNADKQVPSYFNRIVEEIREGKRSSEWAEFHGTPYDNPHLSVDGIKGLIAEYEPESIELEQEVFAKLLKGGAGAALPQLDRKVHLIAPLKIPSHWRRWGAFDWGFDHPWVFGDFASDEDGTVYLVSSAMGRRDLPEAIAEKIQAHCATDSMYVIACGHDTWQEHKQRSDDTPTVAEELQKAGLTQITKANIDRVAGLNNMRRYVAWRGQNGEPDSVPKFFVFRGEGSSYDPYPGRSSNDIIFAGLERAVLDPKEREKPLEVRAVNGKNGDDEFTMVRYGLAARPLNAVVPEEAELDNAWSPEALYQDLEKRRVKNIRMPAPTASRADTELDPEFGAY